MRIAATGVCNSAGGELQAIGGASVIYLKFCAYRSCADKRAGRKISAVWVCRIGGAVGCVYNVIMNGNLVGIQLNSFLAPTLSNAICRQSGLLPPMHGHTAAQIGKREVIKAVATVGGT